MTIRLSLRFTALRSLAAVLTLALMVAGVVCVWAAESETLSAEQVRTQGERMYRDGVLPSGEVMKAYVSGDVPVDGSAFTCVSCHLHSGLGSIEGEVVTPPTNGRILYQPREPFIKGFEHVPSYANYAKYLPVRPAYTDESLGALIATGIDPTGRSVLHVMPRYDIDEQDMGILIAYLKTLSDQTSPGVTDEVIRFATVIVDGTDPLAVQSMLLPLQFGVDRKNSLAVAARNNDRMARMAYNMLGPDLMAKQFSLAQWILKGPSDTWREQLEAYYAAEPVFALLGGISEGDWEPVHRFCEDKQLPNLFPVVDYPVISDTDWYTLYLSRGIRQEGEAAARYLSSLRDLLKEPVIVQVFRDNRRGQTLADGFRQTWQEVGLPAASEVSLPADQALTAERLQKIVAEHKPSVLLVWDDASAIPALSELAGTADAPQFLFASATWLDEDLYAIAEPLRSRLYMTYPYRMPQEDLRFNTALNKVLKGQPLSTYEPQVLKKAYIANEILGDTLMEMRSEYYRDFLFDSIGMRKDTYLPLYERLTFGAGQRYASKGCFIVQLGQGDKPQLERRSEWLIK